MARKKKEVTAQATAPLKYTGEVTIEKIRANKVIKTTKVKNTGCFPLFKFFASCIALYDDKNADSAGLFNSKPQYLNAYYVADWNNLTLSSHEVLKSYIKLSSISVTDNNAGDLSPDSSCSVNLKFLIQDNNFSYRDTEPQHKINCLALYSGFNVSNPDKPMAYIQVPLSNDLKYDPGVNYLITWSIKVSN